MTNEEIIRQVTLVTDEVKRIRPFDSEMIFAMSKAIEALDKQAVIKSKIEWLKGFGEYEAINVGHILDAFEDCAIDWSDSND